MTVNINLNREVVSLTVGVVVLLYTFITLMWFPGVFVQTLWTLFLLAAATVVGGLAALGIYNALGAGADDEDEDSEDESDEEDTE